MKPLSPNVLIQDRYLIVHLIGKGGMGEVYLAVDQRLGSAVALKRTFFSDDDMFATAFEREARILANLRHPILPKVSDHFVDGENQFLVMEHITGDDLSKRLEKTQQAFPLSWVLFWADQLLDALHFLHTHEPPIIHRDIKPQNLKLTNDNHIVLLDFGLSKNSVGETRTSSGGSIVGYTPHYAPMEQIRGTGTNAQSDLYSLSATVYQLITNIVPPDALTRADSLLSGLPDPLRPINDINKEVSPEVSAVVLKGMDIRQDGRHSSAREMQKELRDAYSKLQSAMTANTIAFSVQSENIVSDNKSAVAELPSEPLPEIQPNSDDLAFDSASSLVNELNQTNEFHPVPNFSASDKPADVQHSDIKTEVLLAGESPAIMAAQEGTEIPVDVVYPSNAGDVEEVESFKTSDDFDLDDAFASSTKATSDESFAPQETFPLNSMDGAKGGFDSEVDAFEGVGGHGDTEFFSSIEVDENRGAEAAFITGNSVAKSAELTSDSEARHYPNAKKSSGSKKIAVIIGLLSLLFVVVGVVGGVSWFIFKGSFLGGQETPSPTQEATVAVTPSLEPTIDDTLVTDNSNISVEPTNVNSKVVVDGSNVNAKPTETIITQPTARPTQTPVRPVTTPSPVIKPTVKPTATPKKTPTPGGILQ